MPGVLGKKCGRGLAPDEGVSVTYWLTDPAPSGASPLPHLDLHPSGRPESVFALSFAALEPTGVVPGVLGKKCGRGLAPDEGVSEVRPRSWTPIQFLGRFHEQVHHAVQAICHHRFP